MNMRRRLFSTLAVLVALGLAVAPSANAFPEPSGELIPGAEETVLRLHDLPPGYEVGDESGCGALGPVVEADWFKGRFARRYMNWVFKYRPEGCGYQYERVFDVPGLGPAPPLVEALTLNTPSEAAASIGFGLVIRLFNHDKEGQYRKTVSIPPSGVQASLFRSKNELVEGRIHRHATILFWRSGKLISFVEAAGMSPRRNDRAALHFAQIQQERLEHPSLYTETELEEAFAGWVGPPGDKAALWYGGFSLDTWTRRSWKRFQHSTVWSLNLKRNCVRETKVALEGGSAIVFAGYGRRRLRSCPRQSPDDYWAIAHLGRMVIGVDFLFCTLCRPEHGYGPYNSLAGMKAILSALTLRPKPIY